MRYRTSILLAALLALAPLPGRAQTQIVVQTAPAATTPAASVDPRAKKLLDQMVTALGGDLWLNRRTIYTEGRTAAFFHGAPTGAVIPFWDYRLLPDLERSEYTKKRDDVLLFNATDAFEITYKGKVPLPKDQLEDILRRRKHTLENIVGKWLKAPGVMIVNEGTAVVERHLVDKLSILAPDNDAVTLELDQTTHLPLRRTFRYRNEQFKDWDEDAEEYDDYHTIQGLPTPFSITRYHNGDMQNQRFITKVEYNNDLAPAIFDVNKPLLKK